MQNWYTYQPFGQTTKARAEEIARQKEHQYEASGGHTVRWTFQWVEALAPLIDDEIGEGTEVYWEFFEKVDKAPS